MVSEVIKKDLANGRAWVRDFKVKEALRKKEDLEIWFKGKKMVIKNQNIKDRIIGKSGITYTLPYVNNGNPYELIFFKWSPLSDEYITKQFLGY